jgi:cysteine desulfurase / selenocysteine lyase
MNTEQNIFDLHQVRLDTGGSAGVTHLNNCGAALPPECVVDAVIQHLRAECEIGPYEAATAASQAASRLYDAAAALIGCDPAEIAFCDSATRAWNVLLYSLRLKRGDLVLVSPIDFGGGLSAVQHVAERAGADVEILRADDYGRACLDDLSRLVSARAPALVAITHTAAHSGVVNDVASIGRIVKEAGALYIVDACQAVGQMAVSVDDLRCDGLTATGRKWLRGPRGTGFLYVRRSVAELIDPVTTDLLTANYSAYPDEATGSRLKIRSDARKFEVSERSVAGAIGFGVALQYLLDLTQDGHAAYERIQHLAQFTIDRLSEISRVELWPPPRAESGIVGFTVEGVTPETVKATCAAAGINISTMAGYNAPLDFARRSRFGVCRVAPHYYNTEAEIDAFIETIAGIR